MYKRILVPVDGSTFSQQIIPHAAVIASTLGAELVLFRVVDKPEERDAANRYLEELATRNSAKTACVVSRAGAAAAIRQEAGRVPDTLVAISSHGRSGTMQVLLGSVASEVLHGIEAPVLLYRPNPKGAAAPAKFANVVLPLDGSHLSETIVPQAAGLAKELGAKLVLISVTEPSRQPDPTIPSGDIQESSYVHGQASDIARRYGVSVTWEVLHGEPSKAIPQFVRDLEGAILAMTTHGRTGLQGVLTGSVMAECLRASGVPVLTRLP